MRFLTPLVILLPIALFLLIARMALPENALDFSVAKNMRDFAESYPVLRYVMIGFTHLGGVPMMVLVAVGGGLILAWMRRYGLAGTWVLVALFGGLVDLGLKEFFDRDRPPAEWRDAAVSETNESFPSGHSMGGLIGYGMVAYLVWLGPWRRSSKALAITGLGLLILGIGFSRIFLRAHWLTDVLAGFAMGLAWLALCLSILEYRRKQLARRRGALQPTDSPT